MAMIAMSAILLSAPKLLGIHWELFRWIIPVFVFLVLCKIARADDRMSEMSFVQPLLTLLFFWISYSIENRNAEEPTEYRKRRSKRIKVSTSPSPPPPRRKNRKDKKKKTRMEKEKLKAEDEPSKPATTGRSIMEPLQEFCSLNMDESEIYAKLSRFVLTRKQLQLQDYPLDSPYHPGHVYPESSLAGNVTERRCVRCKAVFFVERDVYKCSTYCVYHLPWKTSRVTGRYQCCNGDQFSTGCMVSAYHVTAQHSFDGVTFHRIREKRQVKGGEFCNVFGLDCEMSYTTAGLEVVKVGLVGLDGLAVYETYVKPDNMVLDYNTHFSGVTAEHLKGVTTSLADVQAYLLKTLNKNSILVGHALSNDLKALRIIHERVVDTSVIFPHKHNIMWKYSLRTLAQEHLGKDIQEGSHDCVEDARTCMALVLKKIADLPAEDENRNSFLLNIPVCRPLSAIQPACRPAAVVPGNWFLVTGFKGQPHINDEMSPSPDLLEAVLSMMYPGTKTPMITWQEIYAYAESLGIEDAKVLTIDSLLMDILQSRGRIMKKEAAWREAALLRKEAASLHCDPISVSSNLRF